MSKSAPANSGKHRARKRFGQNFLHDQHVIDRIIAAIQPRPDDNLVEIGPGQGAISEGLLERLNTLNVIELDRDLVPILEQKFTPLAASSQKHFNLYQGDALKFDFATLCQDKPLRVVGNLPYNISTPLLFHLLKFHSAIRDMHFMLQLELVNRLEAKPGSKAYGRLSVMIQYYCHVEKLFEVPPSAFTPAPKVDSAVVRLTPREPILPASNIDRLDNLLKQAFSQRRKTLRNTLKHWLNQQQMEEINAPVSLRPEQISIEEFVKLSNQLEEIID